MSFKAAPVAGDYKWQKQETKSIIQQFFVLSAAVTSLNETCESAHSGCNCCSVAMKRFYYLTVVETRRKCLLLWVVNSPLKRNINNLTVSWHLKSLHTGVWFLSCIHSILLFSLGNRNIKQMDRFFFFSFFCVRYDKNVHCSLFEMDKRTRPKISLLSLDWFKSFSSFLHFMHGEKVLNTEMSRGVC